MKDKPLSSSVVGTDLTSGKEVNKVDLCRRFSLDPKKPLFSFIGRLVVEKGADLLPGIVYKALLRKDISILILGEGKAEISAELSSLTVHFKSDLACITGFDEVLAHQIYAGSDFLLMPSRTEPCGLNQMYAMRYGTIPIVRRTGGLNDTVKDIGDDGFGICHVQASVKDVTDSIYRAIELYVNKKKLLEIRKKCMRIDHSWNNSALEYLNLYKSLTH
ncbi:glycosyltransferase [Lutimonas saemankumensis]|uniref:glycogen synthase n=1 Tax=Lutimonas saemankumensis TaxID=483016 RepID=UPI001CD2167C|nr:glycosyltransferase [Lutimonas saemankumensis]MCA0930846.1 glycosyltransferase [Lutimonas saemankumensis]